MKLAVAGILTTLIALQLAVCHGQVIEAEDQTDDAAEQTIWFEPTTEQEDQEADASLIQQTSQGVAKPAQSTVPVAGLLQKMQQWTPNKRASESASVAQKAPAATPVKPPQSRGPVAGLLQKMQEWSPVAQKALPPWRDQAALSGLMAGLVGKMGDWRPKSTPRVGGDHNHPDFDDQQDFDQAETRREQEKIRREIEMHDQDDAFVQGASETSGGMVELQRELQKERAKRARAERLAKKLAGTLRSTAVALQSKDRELYEETVAFQDAKHAEEHLQQNLNSTVVSLHSEQKVSKKLSDRLQSSALADVNSLQDNIASLTSNLEQANLDKAVLHSKLAQSEKAREEKSKQLHDDIRRVENEKRNAVGKAQQTIVKLREQKTLVSASVQKHKQDSKDLIAKLKSTASNVLTADTKLSLSLLAEDKKLKASEARQQKVEQLALSEHTAMLQMKREAIREKENNVRAEEISHQAAEQRQQLFLAQAKIESLSRINTRLTSMGVEQLSKMQVEGKELAKANAKLHQIEAKQALVQTQNSELAREQRELAKARELNGKLELKLSAATEEASQVTETKTLASMKKQLGDAETQHLRTKLDLEIAKEKSLTAMVEQEKAWHDEASKLTAELSKIKVVQANPLGQISKRDADIVRLQASLKDLHAELNTTRAAETKEEKQVAQQKRLLAAASNEEEKLRVLGNQLKKSMQDQEHRTLQQQVGALWDGGMASVKADNADKLKSVLTKLQNLEKSVKSHEVLLQRAQATLVKTGESAGAQVLLDSVERAMDVEGQELHATEAQLKGARVLSDEQRSKLEALSTDKMNLESKVKDLESKTKAIKKEEKPVAHGEKTAPRSKFLQAKKADKIADEALKVLR